MWMILLALVMLILGIKVAIRGAKAEFKEKREIKAKPSAKASAIPVSAKKPISSVLDANGHQAADILGAIDSGNWDWARAALQKMAYSMVGDSVSQTEKDQFKALMTLFSERDPLYRDVIGTLLPIIQRQPGILQSKIYEFAPAYDEETIRYVLYFAHELGDLYRLKKGRSYQLFIPGQQPPEPVEMKAKKAKPTKEERYAMSVDYANKRLEQLTDPDLIKTRPYWKYISNATMQVPCHTEWDGLVLRYDDPWWEKHFPPNGVECRCRVTAVPPDEYMGQTAPLEP